MWSSECREPASGAALPRSRRLLGYPWYQRRYQGLLGGGLSPPRCRPRRSLPVGLSIGMSVEVDGGLDVGVAELLLDEVDRLAGGKPEVPSIHSWLAELRADLIKNGVFVPDGDRLRLTQDYVFDSPSAAAGVMMGRAANGRTEWRTPDGKTLKEFQEEALQG